MKPGDGDARNIQVSEAGMQDLRASVTAGSLLEMQILGIHWDLQGLVWGEGQESGFRWSPG